MHIKRADEQVQLLKEQQIVHKLGPIDTPLSRCPEFMNIG